MKHILLAALGVLTLALALVICIEERLPLLSATSAEADETTLVLDAGHGGFDGGAVGVSGTTEQDINLSIVQRTAQLAGLFGVQTVLTRTDREALRYDPARSVRENKVADIKARAEIAAQMAHPVFISVHLNQFSDAQYHGAQVFYSKNHEASQLLAEQIQACLICGADPANHRQAKPAENTIYLMRTLSCPAVIVECGFLSNPTEEQKLGRETYQKTLAMCIICGYLRQNTLPREEI